MPNADPKFLIPTSVTVTQSPSVDQDGNPLKPIRRPGMFPTAPEYGLGDKVFMKYRDGKFAGVVVGLNYRSEGWYYVVAWPHMNGEERCHNAIELTRDYEPEF